MGDRRNASASLSLSPVERKVACSQPDEERLTEDIIVLTRQFGRKDIA